MTADLLDVLDLAEAKQAINMDDANPYHEAELSVHVTAISRRMDELIGPVVNRTVTEYHDGGPSTLWPFSTPVASVTTVSEYDGVSVTVLTAETFGSDPDDAYVLDTYGDTHGQTIIRRSYGRDGHFPHRRRAVELVYVAGRAATTADVDRRIKQTASSILRRMWKREAGVWSQSPDFFVTEDLGVGNGFFKAVDPHIREMLADEMKPAGIA